MKNNNKKCINCLSERFAISAKNLCKRCYPISRKIEIINKWDFDIPQTLIGYPKDGIFNNLKSFEKIKKGFLEQYKERLDHLRYIEEKLNSQITGLDLEYKLRNISKLAGSKADFFGYVGVFEGHFNNKQMHTLYSIFNNIVENIRWDGIDWYRLWDNK
jgi:hypothetical protein